MQDDSPITVETKVTEAGTWAKMLGVKVPVEIVNKEFDKVCGELANAVRLPGFRPGKVPRNVIEKKYGDDIKKQVTSNILQRALRSAIVQEKLEVVGHPDMNPEKYVAEKGQAFAFDVEVEIKPTFTLGEYKGLAVEQEEIEVLPEETQQASERILERFAETVEADKDHAVVDRDVATGVLRVLVDGAEVHKEEDSQLLVMQGHVIGAYSHLGDKFLLGAKAGEKRTVEEVLGNHFPVEAHRGKKATLEFEIKSIKSRKMPEINDELAAKVGMKTGDELKDKIRSSLLESVGNQIRQKTQYELLDKVVAASPFDLPKRLTQMMSDRTTESSIQQLAQMGVDFNQLGEEKGKVAEDANKRAQTEMRRFFVVDAICAKEGIEVTDEDVDEEIVKLARSQNMRASDLYDKLLEQDQLGELQADLKIRKVLEYLVEQANVKIVPRKPPEKDKGHEHAEHAPGAHDHGHDHGHSHGHEHGHEHGH
jgi:trigger factor